MDANPIALSEAFATLVEKSAPFVVAVHARPTGSSGVLTGPQGVVVAAEHTIERESGITVRLHDGRELPAILLGSDVTTGLCALRIDATGLPAVEWVDLEPLKVGHLVFALSRPHQATRASLGIVSALGKDPWRSPAGGRLDRYLQTDLTLQLGFSGSLLVDAAGGALGINHAGILRRVSMTVPGGTVRRVVQALVAHGRVRRGFLGIGAYPIPLPPAAIAECGQDDALLIISVQPGGSAERAGLMLGDAILAIGGEALTDLTQLHAALDEDRIGQQVAARILRAGKVQEIAMTIDARP